MRRYRLQEFKWIFVLLGTAFQNAQRLMQGPRALDCRLWEYLSDSGHCNLLRLGSLYATTGIYKCIATAFTRWDSYYLAPLHEDYV